MQEHIVMKSLSCQNTNFEEYFKKLNEARKDDLSAEYTDFIYDLVNNLCLMYFEGNRFHFTHRSFQEYFCALYFSKQKDKTLKAIGDSLKKSVSVILVTKLSICFMT
mgnify:CR=1 FL=1